MTNTATTDKVIARAFGRATAFAAAARSVESNVVTVEVEEERLSPSSPLVRHYRVIVVDRVGRTTMATWTADVERSPYGGRRSVRFFGWGFSSFTKGKRISEGLARIRVSY